MPPIVLWKAIVEILILATGVYVVLRFLEGTMGAAILRGFAVVVGIALFFLLFVAQAFDLSTIYWVLTRALTLAAIGLIVIFQPDLRRALVRLGESSLFHVVARDHATVVDEIVSGAEKMAARRIGALIAVQRSTGLKPYTEGGVKLDAKVTSELLQTIFYPNTPLSDGAVVIHENRVIAAGCLFPLTERAGLSLELGTRHRAGIGVTEETDAIAVIVSEERGEIALAVRGQLHRQLNSDSLARLLRDLLSERAAARGPQSDKNVELGAE